MPAVSALRALPSVDQVLREHGLAEAIDHFGRTAAANIVRLVLAEARQTVRTGGAVLSCPAVALESARRLATADRDGLRAVFNLTGTVLHTNLGRATLADGAVDAAVVAMKSAVALEYDLATGARGERDDHLRNLLCELTGADDATVVNNNAAAVFLALNTIGIGKEAIVSRGELIEIGGAFRMPDIMARAGVRLHEVGTTNRTHERDYRDAIRADTAMILKVHTSNYRVEGFTADVGGRALAAVAHEAEVPLVNDLGSGTLIDLSRFGLSKEPTVRDAVVEGADLVLFSGDKLLGGPQAGFIVGRKDLVAACNRNPLKRALRLDKTRIAAVSATLKLYRDPDRLAERLPTLRLLARTASDIRAQAERLTVPVASALGAVASVSVCDCRSQIGSGALPVETLPSAGLRITTQDRHGLDALVAAFRALSRPIIGRVRDGAVLLDLRCLEDEASFLDTLSAMTAHGTV